MRNGAEKKLPIRIRVKHVLQSLENPTYLSRRYSWLYWRIYGFSWQDYYKLFDNPLARASVLATFVGYLIFLNDVITEHVGFEFVTANASSILGLDLRTKLHFIFFGLLLISIGRLWYLWRRPNALRLGPSLQEWVNAGISQFTYFDFVRLYEDIETNGHRTIHGKYYTDDWNAFQDDAIWKQSGRTDGLDDAAKRESRIHVNFASAKLRHESLLRSILIDRYSEFAATRKISLLFCVITSIAGYSLFLLPNLDLILTIMSTFLVENG